MVKKNSDLHLINWITGYFFPLFQYMAKYPLKIFLNKDDILNYLSITEQGVGNRDVRTSPICLFIKRKPLLPDSCDHGPNNYKDAQPQMSSLLVFNRVYRLEIQSVMFVFSIPLVK